eukprot:s772_g20.t1
MLQPISALQAGPPLARHFIDSSAMQMDREYGSGEWPARASIHFACPSSGIRFGEARNPGPVPNQAGMLTVGVSNPGGLRSKEDIVMQMGVGIWTMTETQLSQVTTRNSVRAFKAGGNKLNRHIRPHFSHPAPLRAGSTWAGRWSGVCTVSDWPSMKLQLPWPKEHWATGRVLLTRHWIQQTPITVGGFYGYAQGPTWPRAKALSDQLLTTFTREVVIGMSGIRILVGDYNQEPGDLVQQQLWAQYGWCNAQTLGVSNLHHVWMPTCKHATERDQIWLSPEAAQLMRAIHIQEQFADHATLSVQLQLPMATSTQWRWPRPAEISWDRLDTQDWQPTCSILPEAYSDTTEFLKDWATSYESAISEHMEANSHGSLPSRCLGRAQRLAPLKMEVAPPVCKPSREGEVCLQSSMVGAAVRLGSTMTFDLCDEVVQRVFISDVTDVLSAFSEHWSARWNLLKEIPAADWTRIVQFTQAHMPRLSFSLPELTPEMWYKAVKRFKPKAA